MTSTAPIESNAYRRSTGLVDVLDRVLDKGLVVAGDIRVSLAEVELVTIRIRLLICSIDKAEQIGQTGRLQERIRELEQRLAIAEPPGRRRKKKKQ
jgi:hypothetical protein